MLLQLAQHWGTAANHRNQTPFFAVCSAGRGCLSVKKQRNLILVAFLTSCSSLSETLSYFCDNTARSSSQSCGGLNRFSWHRFTNLQRAQEVKHSNSTQDLIFNSSQRKVKRWDVSQEGTETCWESWACWKLLALHSPKNLSGISCWPKHMHIFTTTHWHKQLIVPGISLWHLEPCWHSLSPNVRHYYYFFFFAPPASRCH